MGNDATVVGKRGNSNRPSCVAAGGQVTTALRDIGGGGGGGGGASSSSSVQVQWLEIQDARMGVKDVVSFIIAQQKSNA